MRNYYPINMPRCSSNFSQHEPFRVLSNNYNLYNIVCSSTSTPVLKTKILAHLLQSCWSMFCPVFILWIILSEAILILYLVCHLTFNVPVRPMRNYYPINMPRYSSNFSQHKHFRVLSNNYNNLYNIVCSSTSTPVLKTKILAHLLQSCWSMFCPVFILWIILSEAILILYLVCHLTFNVPVRPMRNYYPINMPRYSSNFSQHKHFRVLSNNYNNLYNIVCSSTSTPVLQTKILAHLLQSCWSMFRPVFICSMYLPREPYMPEIKMGPRVTSTCLVSFGHLFVLLLVHQRSTICNTFVVCCTFYRLHFIYLPFYNGVFRSEASQYGNSLKFSWIPLEAHCCCSKFNFSS